MIKIPTYQDFLVKLVSFLGINYNEETNETDNCVIKELRCFSTQVECYLNDYKPKIVKALAGNDREKAQAIHFYLPLIESRMRHLSDKDYHTLATQKRGLWALCVFYYVPQLACLISLYKNDYDISKHLIENDFMLPIAESNKISSPTKRLIKYLKGNIKGNDFLDEYLNELKNHRTTRYQTKARIIKKLSSHSNNSIHIEEIDSIIHCAIFVSHVYQELCRVFKDKNKVLVLIEYFRKCLSTCDTLYLNDPEVKEGLNFERLVGLHLGFLQQEIAYTHAELQAGPGSRYFNAQQRERNERFSDVFVPLHLYLRETRAAEMDILEDIDTDDLFKGMLRYYALQPSHSGRDRENDEIRTTLNLLGYFFENPIILNEWRILFYLNKIEVNEYVRYYEYQFLFYKALHYLAKNKLTNAIENLKLAISKGKTAAAGKTNVKASSLLIILRLITDHRIGYSHLNPEIKTIIESQSEELIPLDNFFINEEVRQKKIDLAKILGMIIDFNANGYCRYPGIVCIKYNPFHKLDAFIADFFKNYDDLKYSSEDEEMKVERAIEVLVRGRQAKYRLNKQIVTLLQFTLSDALKYNQLIKIIKFYRDSKIPSENLERLLDSHSTYRLLIKTLQRLSSTPLRTV
jgi:hypothetical protein